MCGVCTLVSQVFMVRAYAFSPAREISVFDYSQGLFAAVWGFVLFSEIPDTLSFIGYAIIICMALYMFFHERKAHREKQTQ